MAMTIEIRLVSGPGRVKIPQIPSFHLPHINNAMFYLLITLARGQPQRKPAARCYQQLREGTYVASDGKLAKFYTDDIHFQPFVYEEFNMVLFNMVCPTRPTTRQ